MQIRVNGRGVEPEDSIDLFNAGNLFSLDDPVGMGDCYHGRAQCGLLVAIDIFEATAQGRHVRRNGKKPIKIGLQEPTLKIGNISDLYNPIGKQTLLGTGMSLLNF